jgi:hypothetical protein
MGDFKREKEWETSREKKNGRLQERKKMGEREKF